MNTLRVNDRQIIAILNQTDSGTPVPEPCRGHDVSRAASINDSQTVRQHPSPDYPKGECLLTFPLRIAVSGMTLPTQQQRPKKHQQ